ncbi:MAG: hypothetical protein LQ350_000110 [Teloschistes chrysophthalmus]|nr:MAG: hypothetical protein LQ350_000110 [Niorma chrysophthalma]
MSLSCFPKKPATRTPQTPTFNIQTGIEEGYAAWPPRVVDTRHLGYINAKDTYFYSQDIGRSFRLGGRTYIIFGDTFCNDHGISSNTYKIIPDLTVPTQAFYLSGPHNGYIHPLIEPTRAETEWLALPENLGVKRLAFWCYGGVVEFADGIGWTWYQKYVVDTTTTTAGGGVLDLIGVGLARLSVNNNNNNNNNKKSGGGSNNNGELSAARMPGLMFEQAEGHPLFGSFSTLLAGSHVYLWGQIASSDVFLARVHKDDCHLRHKYTYWNGSAYTDDISRAAPVLQDYQQGAFFHAPQLFGERLAWCFVGVTKWGDSTVMMGKAERVEGPWDDVRPVTHAYGIKNPEGYRYCVYPHPLLLEGGRGRGRVVVSWSENWPGGVIAVELELERG